MTEFTPDRTMPGSLIGATASAVRDFIERERRALGIVGGWSYLYGPEANIQSAKVVTIGLNPTFLPPETTDWHQPRGNSYVEQCWKDLRRGPLLQTQVKAVFARALGETDREFDPLDARILSFQFVPYGSNSWSALPHAGEAEQVGCRLFEWFYDLAQPAVIVCVGRGVLEANIPRLTGASQDHEPIKIGWGNVGARRYRTERGERLIFLPHLARYTVMDRERSQSALDILFESVAG